ncbi:MAG: flagellar export chaperone FliS [Gammaproteobacteria bacterium]|nr:MAG: flagellar export chaperone FliS [Gammaproteobacteria bacterium]
MNSMHRTAGFSRGANAYANVGVESGVMSADPHQLILMLFDGVEVVIRNARLHMEKGNVVEKGKSISKAIDIVNQGLLAALDREQGGEVAENLARIYEYVSNLLLRANLHNDLTALSEAEHLLAQIASAWRDIGLHAKAS